MIVLHSKTIKLKTLEGKCEVYEGNIDSLKQQTVLNNNNNKQNETD